MGSLLCLLGLCNSPLTATANPAELVKNGNFEQVKENAATDWNFSTAKPDNFHLAFPTETQRGHVAQMDAASAVMSGYFNQTVQLKPHTDYHFTALAKLSAGKALLYLHGGNGEEKLDTRIYVEAMGTHPLVPWFWKKEWIEGSSGFPHRGKGLVRNFLAEANQWQPVSIDFNSGALDKVTVSMGAYFEAGNYQFDDVSIIELPAKEHSAKGQQ